MHACALSVLISVGARVEATRGGDNADHQALMVRRRQQRNIDAYLLKSLDVEKLRVGGAPDGAEPQPGGSGSQKKTAYEVAVASADEPVGGTRLKRELRALSGAKIARLAYRNWLASHPNVVPRFEEEEDRQRRPAGMIDKRDLAAIQAEWEDGDSEDGDSGDDD